MYILNKTIGRPIHKWLWTIVEREKEKQNRENRRNSLVTKTNAIHLFTSLIYQTCISLSSHCSLSIWMSMDSPTSATTIDLTLPASDAPMCPPNVDKAFSSPKTKIGWHSLEQYYKDFKEYLTGDHKGKTSATCILCKETVWHLKNSTSNYSRHLQRKHKVEYDLWSTNASKQTKPESKWRYQVVYPRRLQQQSMIQLILVKLNWLGWYPMILSSDWIYHYRLLRNRLLFAPWR